MVTKCCSKCGEFFNTNNGVVAKWENRNDFQELHFYCRKCLNGEILKC